jgi:hypothetical protein
MSNRTHEIIVLGNQASILGSARCLSLLMSVWVLWYLRIFSVLINTFHILCDNIIFWHLIVRLLWITVALRFLLVLVSVECTLIRANTAHAHVVKAHLRLVKQFLICVLLVRWSWEILSFFLLQFTTWCLIILNVWFKLIHVVSYHTSQSLILRPCCCWRTVRPISIRHHVIRTLNWLAWTFVVSSERRLCILSGLTASTVHHIIVLCIQSSTDSRFQNLIPRVGLVTLSVVDDVLLILRIGTIWINVGLRL